MNRTPEMTSRCGGTIIDTGRETWPFGSLIAPVGDGGAFRTTTAVGTEVAFVAPYALRPSTTTRIRWPTSAAVSRTCVPFANPSQALPFTSQRRHVYSNVVGPFVHVPGAAVNTWPSRARPLITGGADAAGSGPRDPTTPVGADIAFDEPYGFFASTSTRIVWPTSPELTVRVWPFDVRLQLFPAVS